MKFLFTAIVIIALATPLSSYADTNDLATFLQRGLFEEEANHQYDAAIADYKAAIDHFDHERQLAATAIFRLGECYRKQGRTNEAYAQYERLVREFPEQTQLMHLSQGYLPATAATPSANSPASTTPLLTDEQKFLLEVKESVQNSPDLINVQLGKAVNQGYLSAAEYLLDHGAEVNPVSSSSPIPLITTARLGNDAMVQLLLRHGAKINATESAGDTAFSIAARHHFMKVCLTLISNRADLNLGWMSPLAEATKNGDEAMVRLLLEIGADTEKRAVETGQGPGEKAETPLGIAAANKSLSICKLLVDHRADLNAKDKTGSTPIYDSIIENDFPTVEFFVNKHANLNVTNDGRETPLLCAMAHASDNIIRLLVDNGADINATELGGLTAIYRSIEKNDYPLTEFLITNHALLNITNDKAETPLLWAMEDASNNIIKLLLDNKADPNQLMTVRGAYGIHLPPLAWAIAASRVDLVSLLANGGADVNAPLPRMSTLGKGYFPNLVNTARPERPTAGMRQYPQTGSTPLYWALHSEDGRGAEQTLEIASALLDHGASPNVINPADHLTPLYRAAANQWVDIVNVLIKHGADVNQTNGHGKAPLEALRSPRTPADLQIEAALIAAGADVNISRRPYIWTMGPGGANKAQIFRCQTNSINHYTLLESIAELYRVGEAHGNTYPSPLGSTEGVAFGAFSYNHGNYMHRESLIRFPDFKHVVIRRLAGATDETSLIDAEEILASGDRSRDVPLTAGDIVEIGNQEHRVAETWKGLPGFDLAALTKMLTRKVAISTKSHTNNLVLCPPVADEHEPDSDDGEPPIPASILPPGLRGGGGTISVRSFFLDKVVRDKEVLLNTWDLSKVRLVRDGQTNTFNLTAPSAPEVWLEDGDLIEISDPSDLGVTEPAQSFQPLPVPSPRRAPPGPPPGKLPGQ